MDDLFPKMAPCGIDCVACNIYQAAHDSARAEKLAADFRASGYAEASPGWFRCQGCWGDRRKCWSDDCAIYACIAPKGLDHCGQCFEFPCATLDRWAGDGEHHRQAVERLKAMRG